MKEDRSSTTAPGIALVIAILALGSGPLASQFRPPPKAAVEAFAEKSSHAAGSPARVAAVVTIDDGWHIQSHTPSFDYLIPTELALDLPDFWPDPDVRYPVHIMWQSQFEADPLAVYEHEATIHADLALPGDLADGAVEIPVVLTYQACDDRICLPPTTAETTLALVIGQDGEATGHSAFAAASTPPVRSGGTVLTLLSALIPALLGGLILNGMPCVLPVVSLKLFGLAQASGRPRREIVFGALMTTLGILASFWALAGATFLARSAGQAVGWGIQFQNPLFVSFLVLVLTLFSLNTWGLFEIGLPHAIMNRLGGGRGQGGAGHFFSGVFATLMATPCSAPFLGTAVGFALSQSTTTILVVFTAVGIGLAAPYLVLAAAPGTIKLLPRPGEWMVTLRGVMGFFLFGTTVWLLYVLAGQMDSARLAFVQIGLLALALFVWLQSRGPSTAMRFACRAGGVGAALLVLLLANGAAAHSTDTGRPAARKVLDWVPFDPVQADSLAAEGRLVFVDVTADWCATCKVNERLVLETDETAALFARHQVVAMQADWTNRNDDIARYLASFGRYGIPFYALYRPGAEPHVFSELLRSGHLEEAIRAATATRASR